MSEITTQEAQEKTKRKGKFSFSSVALLLVIVVIGILYLHGPLKNLGAYRRRGYDADVKANIKNVAMAQETYFEDNRTYTNRIGSLEGFNQSVNVNITMEATTTTFVITGTTKKGCSPNTGTWTFNSTAGAIDGTPCQ